MGKREKKTGKGRLDKYYKLAKEQGYRARSAFKLIQLNKRYQFLEAAKCCIDLCAAPGGWLQVAAKWMPPNALILGVDLVPIKPIPRVLTATHDIRTESCRKWLRNELKDWKADVVMHDGAPNVGTAWVQDAFTQSELVLHSLKLATEVLAHGGVFITKIFRSKDYNSLLYVFNQLFKQVEATKPPASRNVSAEIFVVCQGYLALKKIDPRLLDPAHVFKDLDLTQNLNTKEGEVSSSKLTQNVQNVFKPEKKRRMRDGYDEGDYTLHKITSAHEFITAKDPIKILGVVNTVSFGDSPNDQQIYKLKATNKEIKTSLQDLKVLGKGDFKKILKWRVAVRELLGLDQKPTLDTPIDNTVVVEELDEDEVMEQELLRLKREATLHKKRERRRLNEKRTRDVQRMQLQMTTPMDIGQEVTDAEVFGLSNMDSHAQSSDSVMEDIDNLSQESHNVSRASDSDTDDEQLSEEDIKIINLEESLGEAYDQYQKNQLKRDAKQKAREEARRQRHNEAQGEHVWKGCSNLQDSDQESSDEIHSADDIEVVRRKRAKHRLQQDEEDNSDNEGEDVTIQADRIVAIRDKNNSGQKSTRASKCNLLVNLKAESNDSAEVKKRAADIWFDQPVFRDFPETKDLLSERFDHPEHEGQDESPPKENDQVFEDDPYMRVVSDQESDLEVESAAAEPDVWAEDLSDQDQKNDAAIQDRGILTPQAMQLALDLVNRKRTKDELIESGFRRDAFFDDKSELPSWFLDDEMRHFREHVPVTKEAVKLLRDKMRALNARPIKKVAEAKGRKKLRTIRRVQKMQSKANLVNETSDLTEKEKSKEIEKLMNRMHKNPKTRREVKVVVAKGANKGNKGRPKGVKGRYKMVDARGRKELRAIKRQQRTKSKR